jgi:hypothetical protein
METILLPEARIPLIVKADVVVVGAGPAGVAAAIQAAREGASTALVERFGSPGGMMTNGLMSVTVGGSLGELQTEIFQRLHSGGHIVNPLERDPRLSSNPLFHYFGPNIMKGRKTASEIHVFDPHMTSIFMNEMLEESGVQLCLGTLFVDAKVEGQGIEAVVVENVSGRQAIGGKVFVDATGHGVLAARCGVPCRSAGSSSGPIIPPGLMWKMSHVDLDRLFEYQKEDPFLEGPIERASADGKLPHYRPKRMDIYGGAYSGQPRPEMCPTPYPGEVLLWASAPHEWRLNCAESAGDLNRAELALRKHILGESIFLARYVPGFEKAYVTGIAPMMGIREGRLPEGEYVMRYEDIRDQRRFEDAVLHRRSLDWFDTAQGSRMLSFDVPYRSFIAREIRNLLLAGDNISMAHEALLHMRGLGWAMRTGEIAGISAARSLKSGVSPKELKWTA